MKEENLHDYLERCYKAGEISKKDYTNGKIIATMTDGFSKMLKPLEEAIKISKAEKK